MATQEQVSLAPLTGLHCLVIRLISHRGSPRSGDIKTSLNCLRTLREGAFETCIVILPFPSDPVAFDRNVIEDLTEVPTESEYIDMFFGHSDPWFYSIFPAEMSVKSTRNREFNLLPGNIFDNRLLFRQVVHIIIDIMLIPALFHREMSLRTYKDNGKPTSCTKLVTIVIRPFSRPRARYPIIRSEKSDDKITVTKRSGMLYTLLLNLHISHSIIPSTILIRSDEIQQPCSTRLPQNDPDIADLDGNLIFIKRNKSEEVCP